jgi:hypothetical protein
MLYDFLEVVMKLLFSTWKLFSMFFSYSLIVIITYIYNQIGYLCFVIVTVIASCLIKINKIVKNIYSGIVCFDLCEV